MSLQYAYDAADAQAAPIRLFDWLAHHRNSTPRCLICHEDLKVNAVNSQDISAYFSHKQNSSCPTVNNSPPSSSIGRAPKQRDAAAAARAHTLEHLMGVYIKMRERVPDMRWSGMEDACQRARALGVWDLVGLTAEYVPWVLLSCVDRWAVGKKNASFFLEPQVNGKGPWDFSGARKRFLYEVDAKTGSITPHQIDFIAPKSNILARIERLLS